MTDCLFCKIRDKEIPADIVFQDDEIVAFKDIHPEAPVHILIIPRQHIAGLLDITEENYYLTGKMVLAAKKIARMAGIEKSGWRLVFNCGPDAGQAVFHIHLHLLGGRKLNWPAG